MELTAHAWNIPRAPANDSPVAMVTPCQHQAAPRVVPGCQAPSLLSVPPAEERFVTATALPADAPLRVIPAYLSGFRSPLLLVSMSNTKQPASQPSQPSQPATRAPLPSSTLPGHVFI